AAAVLGAAVVRVGIGQGGMAARVAGAMVTMHLAWGAGFWSGLAARAARMMGGAWRPGGRA
ncbi:MAG: glycosyltransferase family 2 protein, partial [Anaerolineae bacterium]